MITFLNNTNVNLVLYQTIIIQIIVHSKCLTLFRLYHEKFAAAQKGVIGITLNIHWAEPRDPTNSDDIEAAERYLQFNFGWFAHPILKDGKYPPVMREKINDKSKKQGT